MQAERASTASEGSTTRAALQDEYSEIVKHTAAVTTDLEIIVLLARLIIALEVRYSSDQIWNTIYMTACDGNFHHHDTLQTLGNLLLVRKVSESRSWSQRLSP